MSYPAGYRPPDEYQTAYGPPPAPAPDPRYGPPPDQGQQTQYQSGPLIGPDPSLPPPPVYGPPPDQGQQAQYSGANAYAPAPPAPPAPSAQPDGYRPPDEYATAYDPAYVGRMRSQYGTGSGRVDVPTPANARVAGREAGWFNPWLHNSVEGTRPPGPAWPTFTPAPWPQRLLGDAAGLIDYTQHPEDALADAGSWLGYGSPEAYRTAVNRYPSDLRWLTTGVGLLTQPTADPRRSPTPDQAPWYEVSPPMTGDDLGSSYKYLDWMTNMPRQVRSYAPQVARAAHWVADHGPDLPLPPGPSTATYTPAPAPSAVPVPDPFLPRRRGVSA